MNTEQKQTLFSRGALALLILLSGLAFVPFTGLSGKDIDWHLYAGVYQANLDVDENRGSPGSAFLFTGSGYQANASATVYVNGVPVGVVWTDGSGQAQFLLQTQPDDSPGEYFVTLATDPNFSDTQDIELDLSEPTHAPPPDFDGVIAGLRADQYLPYIANQ